MSGGASLPQGAQVTASHGPGSAPGPIAFFDLDRTLLDSNSGLLWARHELAGGRIGRWQIAGAARGSLMYHLSLIDMTRMYGAALAHYVGEPADDVRARTRAWFEAEVAARLRPGGRAAVAEHRSQGHAVVLLTNSSPYEAEAAAQSFGLDAWIANGFDAGGDGRLLGSFEPPLCFGAGKVARSERWAAARGPSLEGAYFYTDSLSDLPMLERVTHPRVVHPDPRLRRLAQRRGWPIIDWSTAAGPSVAPAP